MSTAVSGYYGKLPRSPEFLRLHATGAEIRWLDEWLQKGVLYAKAKEGSEWMARMAAASLWKFLLVPAHQGRVVCGVLFPSHDKAGRSFPFMTFLLLDRTGLADQPWLIPLVASDYLAEAGSALHGLRQGGEWQAFQKQAEEWNAAMLPLGPAARAFEQYLQGTATASWVEGIGKGKKSLRRDHRACRIEEVVKRVNRLRAGQGPAALQCPLPPTSNSPGADVAFWLAACLQGRPSAQVARSGVFAMWRQDDRSVESSALISLGLRSPNVVRALVSPEAEDDSWQPVFLPEGGSADTGPAGEARGPQDLTEAASSLKGLLDLLQGDTCRGVVRSTA